MAAEALVLEFGTDEDRNLWPAFLHVTQAVRDRVMPVEVLTDSYRQAMNPQTKNRGAVFNHALHTYGWRWESSP
jgi:hypothetical protein